MQDRIRAEIKKSLEASNGELTYDSVLDMQYLGMVLAGEFVPLQLYCLVFKKGFCRGSSNVPASPLPRPGVHNSVRLTRIRLATLFD